MHRFTPCASPTERPGASSTERLGTSSTERVGRRARNNGIALLLSAAAMDGDHARVKQLLEELLRCRARRMDVDLAPQLEALEDLFLLLHSMALTDELTGLCNRRGFLRKGARLLELAAREGKGALLIYLDVDDLKRVNDSWGHEAGDRLLARAARVLRVVSGNHAVIGRLGGDEFAVVDVSTDSGGRKELLRRMHHAVETCNASAAAPRLSLSMGCVESDPRKPASILTLLAQADRAMYEDKVRESRRPELAALQSGS